MKVSDLINGLQKMPQDADVLCLWDGELRTEVNIIYESKGGDVVLADFNDVCYSTNSRPKNAPTASSSPYWHTPKK